MTTKLHLEGITWEEIGDEDDPSNRLLATLQIGGYYMHLEALAVYEDEYGWTRPHYIDRDEDLEKLQDMEGCAFTTLEMNDRDYVLIAMPFGR